MINMDDAIDLIEQHRGDAVVLPTMTANASWRRATHNEPLDIPISGAMGKASSVALGISLARPDKKVFVIDGDGSLLMNLGTLVSIGGKSPENLYHFVLNNDVYAVTGGQPVPNPGGYSLAGIAKESGYAADYEFDNLEDFATSLDEIMNTKGPVLISLKSEPVIENTPVQLRVRDPRRTPQAIKEVKEVLSQ